MHARNVTQESQEPDRWITLALFRGKCGHDDVVVHTQR